MPYAPSMGSQQGSACLDLQVVPNERTPGSRPVQRLMTEGVVLGFLEQRASHWGSSASRGTHKGTEHGKAGNGAFLAAIVSYRAYAKLFGSMASAVQRAHASSTVLLSAFRATCCAWACIAECNNAASAVHLQGARRCLEVLCFCTGPSAGKLLACLPQE